MKKAKIMLMGIAVVALVGGALAFKAAKFNDPNLLTCATTSITNPVKYCILGKANSVTGTATTDPALLFTTATTRTGTTALCTTIIGGVTVGCYDHPSTAFVNP